MRKKRKIIKVFLLLSIFLIALNTLPIQAASVAGDISPVEDAAQTEASSTRGKIVLILGNLLILSLYAFPMSFAEEWSFGDPRKAKERASEAPETVGDWITWSDRLPQWAQRLPRVTAGLAAGGFLMVVVVVIGAIAFALYYNISDQPERVSEIIPRFAYWFPFALLGMVADILRGFEVPVPAGVNEYGPPPRFRTDKHFGSDHLLAGRHDHPRDSDDPLQVERGDVGPV